MTSKSQLFRLKTQLTPNGDVAKCDGQDANQK